MKMAGRSTISAIPQDAEGQAQPSIQDGERAPQTASSGATSNEDLIRAACADESTNRWKHFAQERPYLEHLSHLSARAAKAKLQKEATAAVDFFGPNVFKETRVKGPSQTLLSKQKHKAGPQQETAQGEWVWWRGISNMSPEAQTACKLACGGLLASQLGLMLHMPLTGGYPSMSHDLLPALWQALQVICVAVIVVAGGLLAGTASAHYTRVWWERNPGNIETWTSADVQRSPLQAMDRGERFYNTSDFKELAGVGGVAAGVLAVGHFALLPLLDWFGLLHAPAAPYIILHAAAAGEQLLQAYRLVAMVILLCTVAVWLLCSHCSWVLAAVGERPPPGWLQHIQLIGLPIALLAWWGGEWLALATGAGPLAVMDPATHIGTVRLVVLTDPVMDFVGDALYTVLLSVPYWVVMVGVPGVCWGVVLAVHYVLTLPLYCVGAALWQVQAGVVTTAEASGALAMSPLQVCWDVYSPLAIAGRLWGAITHATWLLTTLCLGEAWGSWLAGWSPGVSAASTVPSNVTLAMCVWARVAGAGLSSCPPLPVPMCFGDEPVAASPAVGGEGSSWWSWVWWACIIVSSALVVVGVALALRKVLDSREPRRVRRPGRGQRQREARLPEREATQTRHRLWAR